ncbi:hypothetical protein QBC46DRAFT_112607 [Diplogelasinospora grovesii]|uniref:Cytochrome c oxidase-assembly factor COX23, mitochondrial n=1 Tax=Diplogelasinospora grovesii TaxID=303347 RepID=A0AAN6N837_9PEZI|nr:hypothetical protein QBC46DRAFT_112607 [Diplogelasinospora grovesii]
MASDASDSKDNSADPWNEKTKTKFETKSRSEFLDPCQEAASRSIRCLHRNGGDRSLCQDYFQAYRDCKKNWIEKRREQKRKEGKLF